MKTNWPAKLLGKNIAGLLTVLVIGGLGSYLVTVSHAATGNCSGSVGTRTYSGVSHAIYNCQFWAKTPVYDVKTDANTGHYFNAGTNWVMCQVIGRSIGTSTTYNHWWAFTESNQGTWGWVNAYYASGGSNNQQFGNVPTGCPAAYGLAPGQPGASVRLSASPTSIAYGASSNLSWSSSNASSCAATGAWSGSKPLSGSVNTGTLRATSKYTITCNGAGGSSASASATVTVGRPPVPTVKLAASPTSITAGSSSKLTWSSTNATGCTASGSWSGSKATVGSVNTSILVATAKYTLSCSGAGGSASASATVTVTASPSPVPTPTPTPTPSPSPSPTPTPAGTPPKPKPNVPSTAPTGYPSNAADGMVELGTTSAVVAVSAGNAAKVHLVYGPSGGQLTSQTPDQSTAGNILIDLTDLKAKSDYNYAIVRTGSSGKVSTSASASFTTAGYAVTLAFVDSNSNGVSDISGSISDSTNTEATSDSSGNMSFFDLESGKYTIRYSYKGHHFIQHVDTAVDDETGDPLGQVITITFSVNVDKLLTDASQAVTLKIPSNTKHHTSAAGTIVGIVLSLAAVAGIVWFLLRRRQRFDQINNLYAGYTGPSVRPDVLDQHTPKPTPKAPQGPPPDHVSISLRDMVIRSMHEEAKKRADQPKPPHVPGDKS